MTADTKNDWLQVLRAVAALMVVFFHARILWEGQPLLSGTQALLHWGFAGVDIFFVLSGYVVWKSADNSSFKASRFLTRRFFRVYLGYWCALALLVSMYAVSGQLGKLAPEHALGSIFLLNIWLHENWLPTAWSLPYELYFYLWVALLCALLPPKGRGPGLVLVLLALAAWTLWCVLRLPHLVAHNVQPFILLATPMGLQFLAGALIAKYLKLPSVNTKRRPARAAAIMVLGLVLATLGFLWGRSDPLFDRVLVWRAISFGWVGVGLLLVALAASMLQWRAPRMLVTIGDASYSLYLLHPLLILFIGKAASQIPPHSLWHLPLAVASITAMVVISLLWYRRIEKPVYDWACGLALQPKARPAHSTQG